MKHSRSQRGFTLAELLLALVILGVIATFTIPKVLQSRQDSQRDAVLKETFSAISSAAYTGVINGTLTQSGYITYFKQNINTVKTCNDAAADGCWPGSSTAGSNTSTADGLVLHNGTMVTDMETNTNADVVWLDWNGPAGPNTNCVDQVPMAIGYGSGAAFGGTVQAGKTYPWTLALFPSGSSTCSDQTYTDLFQN